MSGECSTCGNVICLCAEFEAQERASQPIVKLTIPGRCIVKKNTKNLVGRGRFKRAVYSKRFVEWEQRSIASLAGGVESKSRRFFDAVLIDFEVEAHFKFYFKNRQSQADVSNLIEGPQDLLVKVGVLKDDKLVRKLVAENHFGCGPNDERCEVELFKFKPAQVRARE